MTQPDPALPAIRRTYIQRASAAQARREQELSHPPESQLPSRSITVMRSQAGIQGNAPDGAERGACRRGSVTPTDAPFSRGDNALSASVVAETRGWLGRCASPEMAP